MSNPFKEQYTYIFKLIIIGSSCKYLALCITVCVRRG